MSALNEWFGRSGSGIAELFDRGGTVVWLLFILATIALAIFFIKLWQFASARIARRQQTSEALSRWARGEHDGAIDSLSGSKQPLDQVVLSTMQCLQSGHGADIAREEGLRVGSSQLEQLRSLLRPLELIAILSPLLGLLGTVIGMIEAFQSIETAGTQVDPAVLSGGIWQALLTTAVGLSVAIAVTIAHSWLERRVDRLAHAMDDSISRIFTLSTHSV